jgi:hypothetical protein
MKKKIGQIISLTLIFQSFTLKGVSQSDYQSAGIIHTDSYVTVELQYKLNDPCAGGGTGKKSKYRLNITGRSSGYDRYLNWEMDYYNCDRSITSQMCNYNIGNFPLDGINEEFDWNFDGYKMEKLFYNVTETSRPIQKSSRTRPIPVSTAAKAISGNLNLDYGDQTTLSVTGGILGVNAQWKWYSEICGGKFLGVGETIRLTPTEDKEYFVRAESPTDTTKCVSTRVKINLQSSPPDHIEGKKIICVGEKNVSLSVSGGRLGINAEWVWYQDNGLTIPIGRGRNILVSPEKETTFFVRAESNINITRASSITISILDEKLKDPDKIVGNSFVCSGSSLELKVSGGILPASATWYWYKNDIQPKNLVATGSMININPVTSAVYYVRGEGVCAITKERSITIEVGALSANPKNISSENDLQNKRKTTLSVMGGTLGKNSKWVWYKGSCDGNKMGTGETISVKVNKETVFFVKAEGDCNSTTCISQRVYPRTVMKYTFINFGVIPSLTSGGDLSMSIKKLEENPIVSLTFGKLAKTGWYFRGKYAVKTKPINYSIENNQINDYNSQSSYYVFNGKSSDNRWAVTAGTIMKLNNTFFLQAGLGLGQRDLVWGVSEYSNQNNNFIKESWGKHLNASYYGVEIEAAIVIRLSVFNICLGANAIVHLEEEVNSRNSGPSSNIYIDGYAGIGFSF